MTIKTKWEIIAACDKLPKRTFAQIAEQLIVNRTTINRIYNSKTSLVENADISNSNRKRNRHSKAEYVNDALHQWFVCATATNLPISGEMLRLKMRNGIQYKRMHGEKLDANLSSADEWIVTTFSDVVKRYQVDDIFNVDETAFYYRALPDGSMFLKIVS